MLLLPVQSDSVLLVLLALLLPRLVNYNIIGNAISRHTRNRNYNTVTSADPLFFISIFASLETPGIRLVDLENASKITLPGNVKGILKVCELYCPGSSSGTFEVKYSQRGQIVSHSCSLVDIYFKIERICLT